MLKLIASNDVNEGNILISYKKNLKAFFIPHKYPSLQQYKTGVACGTMVAERINPNAKVFQTPVRQRADELMAKYSYYEVLLVDKKNRITEGSRSNVFFIANNHIFTPPGNEVLIGITRIKTILIAQKHGLEVEERDVHLKDLKNFSAAFITGTSPKILPVNKIDMIPFNSQHEIVHLLISDFELMIEDYIRNN